MIKSQDDLNTCNDGHRSSEVLLATIEKLEQTQKKLDIAIKSINSATGFLTCMDDLSELSGKCNEQMALEELNKAIKQIKELEK